MKKKSFAYQFYHTTEEAWDAMYQALLTATKSIYWEVYVFIDDSVGERFITALSDKARAGIEVKLVVDAIGSFGLSRVGIERLRSAGVEVLIYNRLYPGIKIYSWVSRIFRRNHRKVLIIDEEIVFLGGVNIDAHFHNWDDVYLKIMGKV
ncbi:MAG TPA: phospholipase D-like domain-containing protein, partial [Patescibacteria group bacterium]|nr:phospholipase D-like domain-containing protein [Patescibacteria group bacterium]